MTSHAGPDTQSEKENSHANSTQWREAIRQGTADYFTGTVRIDPLFSPPDPARVSGALVTFEPGARTAWHTHPLGQTLIVTSGLGWIQREGGPIEEIRPGDVIWFEPGEKHWHGATSTTAMSHIACRKSSTARRSTGWNMSRTPNTPADHKKQQKGKTP